MSRFLAPCVLMLGIIFSGCSGTPARVLEGIYALDQSFVVMQELAIAVLDSNVLTAEQRDAVKAADHLISEELKALTDKAMAYQKGNGVAVTAADYEKARSDLGAFKNVLTLLRAQKPAN